MVTIELQLVSLTIIVTLDHLTGVVYIFGIYMPYVLHEDSRWVRQLAHIENIPIQVSIQLLIPLLPIVPLIEYYYAKSLRMRRFLY